MNIQMSVERISLVRNISGVQLVIISASYTKDPRFYCWFDVFRLISENDSICSGDYSIIKAVKEMS